MSASILYIPHGGGPLPLMEHPGHTTLTKFLKTISTRIPKPEAIVVISAHWERDIPVITANPTPELIYDYFGFPQAAYEITYPAMGATDLAHTMQRLLSQARIKARTDDRRGFDHGLFVPLKQMYPDASIPCLQLSLTADLDPSAHLAAGNALSPLCHKNILVLGSGFSFHNMGAFADYDPEVDIEDPENHAFQQWLIQTCTAPDISPNQRRERLIHWEQTAHSRYCHPREEHLLPLHVCAGVAGYGQAETVFRDKIMGKEAVAFLWQHV